MSGKRRLKQVGVASVTEVLSEMDERVSAVSEAVEIGVSGDSKQLRQLQRQMLLSIRDLSTAVCKLYTSISIAENQEELDRLKQDSMCYNCGEKPVDTKLKLLSGESIYCTGCYAKI